MGATVFSTVLAWDKDKFHGSPSWGDFWDVAKLPGKRGLRRGVVGNLEIALLADGVAPETSTKRWPRLKEWIARSASLIS